MLNIERTHFLFGAIFLQSLTFLCGKYATIYKAYVIPIMTLAYVFIGLRAILWQIVLKKNELSKIYPFNSLILVIILIYSYFIFKEAVTLNNLIGVFFMVIGIIVLGKCQ